MSLREYWSEAMEKRYHRRRLELWPKLPLKGEFLKRTVNIYERKEVKNSNEIEQLKIQFSSNLQTNILTFRQKENSQVH